MNDDETQPRRGGRLRKHPAGERRQTFTFRLGGDVKDALLDAASNSGRSLSEELEHRIEASLRGDKRSAFEDVLLQGGKNSSIVRHISSIMTMFKIKDDKEDYELERTFYSNAILEILKYTLPDRAPSLAPPQNQPERSVMLERAQRRGREIGQFVIRETFLDALEAKAASEGGDASWLRRTSPPPSGQTKSEDTTEPTAPKSRSKKIRDK